MSQPEPDSYIKADFTKGERRCSSVKDRISDMADTGMSVQTLYAGSFLTFTKRLQRDDDRVLGAR